MKTKLKFPHGFIAIYNSYKDRFIPLWKNIACWIWSFPKFRFLGGDEVTSEYFDSNFALVFIDLYNANVLFFV